MKELIEKIKENKALKIVWNIIYSLITIFTILMLLVVVLQRVSNNTISLGGIRLFNIVSESMIPKYEIGDILISTDAKPNEIKVGDDIVYRGKVGSFAGKTITHQVIEIENDGKYKFHTKGLANEEEDPIVEEDQIYGVIVYKTIILSFISKIIINLYSFYFVIFIPIVILIFVQIVKIVNSTKENKKKEEKEDK